MLTWSSGFIGARFSIDYAPALLVVFWRCVIVSLVLFPFVARQLRQTAFGVLLKNAGIGLLAMAGYLAGVIRGIALGVPAGLAALFADLLPLGMALLAAVVLGERLVRQVWAGLVIGLAGVVWVTHGALAWGNAPLWAYGLPLAGMLSLAVATLWQKNAGTSRPMGLLPNLWLQCFVSSFAFAAIEGMRGNSEHRLRAECAVDRGPVDHRRLRALLDLPASRHRNARRQRVVPQPARYHAVGLGHVR